MDVERIQHGYDRAGNRLWRETPVAAANGVHLDELYTYDRMNQLLAFARGDLNAAKDGLVTDTKSLAQQWSLDATGNWSNFQEDTDGDGTWDLDQSRTHGAVNEISQIAGTSDHMAHDRAGNMTRVSKSDDWNSHHDLVYDVWNRLVKILDGETTVAEYAYDGRHYRVTKTAAGTTQHYCYSKDWQVIEERIDSSTSADRQFIWGLRDIDDLVMRDCDASDDGPPDERLYALQDANWNVVAICSTGGVVQERCIHTAYGSPHFFGGSFDSRSSSSYDWETLYSGYRWDRLIEAYHVRHRVLFPHLGCWNRRDPIGFLADINLYRYCTSNPLSRTDPLGLAGADIKYIDYLVKKYGLSEAGRKALHQALQDLKGAGGLAPRAAAEAEAQSIAALGGKFLKAGGTALGILGIWLAMENTAQAAEISWDWRNGATRPWGQAKCKCECARFEATVMVPSWWNVFREAEWDNRLRRTEWKDFGNLDVADCHALEDMPRVIAESSVTGYTIYLVSWITCNWHGEVPPS